MPTYDYVCDACGHKFEEFQSMTAERLQDCPKCKKPKLRRLIGGGAGVLFKGSGFYQTDYKKAASTEPAPTPPGPPAGGDKSCGSCGKTGPNVCD